MQHCATYINCSGTNYSPYSKDGDLTFEKCNDCGLIWRSKDSISITKPYEQEYFDSKHYHKHKKHKVIKSGWLIDLARLQYPQINSLLEVGCSIGYTLEAADIRKINHLGIDISKFAVEHCTQIGLNASNQNFQDLIEAGHKYDIIFKQHVLEHFQDPFATLRNCHKLLNKDGIILIMVPNSAYKRAHRKREKHRFYSKKGVGAEHFVYFNYSNLQKTLVATGFKILQKNYPFCISKYNSPAFFLNRLFRRFLSFIKSDQELLIIAQKQEEN